MTFSPAKFFCRDFSSRDFFSGRLPDFFPATTKKEQSDIAPGGDRPIRIPPLFSHLVVLFPIL